MSEWGPELAVLLGLVEGLTEFLPIYAQQLLLPVNKDLANAAPGAVQGVLLLVVLGVARGGLAGLVGNAYRRLVSARAQPTAAPDGAPVPATVSASPRETANCAVLVMP